MRKIPPARREDFQRELKNLDDPDARYVRILRKARLYGHKKLSDLLKQEPKHFVVEERGLPGASAKSVFVKLAA